MRVFGTVDTKPIRTYNYKRDTVTDHRTGVTIPLAQALKGQINPLTDPLRLKVAIPKAPPD